MLEKSIFNSNKEIIEKVKEFYGIDVTKIETEDRGSANIKYLYNEGNKKYVFKEFESNCNEDNVIKESKIINYLQKSNIKVPTYIKTKTGELYFKYKKRTIILMEYIEGYTKPSNSGDFKQTIESAKVLGNLVKALENYPYHMELDNIDKWYNKKKIESGLKKHLNLKEKLNDTKVEKSIKKDVIDKIKILEKLKLMDLEEMKNITYKNSHGDYSIMQFIYKDEKVNAVLDFAKARKMPISWEIMRSYTYIDEKCKAGNIDINNLLEYVKEFQKYVKLNIYDLKFMPHIYLIQLASSTFGYEEYLNNNEQENLLNFAVWRTKMCKTLLKNIDEISDKLCTLEM